MMIGFFNFEFALRNKHLQLRIINTNTKKHRICQFLVNLSETFIECLKKSREKRETAFFECSEGHFHCKLVEKHLKKSWSLMATRYEKLIYDRQADPSELFEVVPKTYNPWLVEEVIVPECTVIGLINSYVEVRRFASRASAGNYLTLIPHLKKHHKIQYGTEDYIAKDVNLKYIYNLQIYFQRSRRMNGTRIVDGKVNENAPFISEESIKNYFRYLSAVFEWASKLEMIPKDPFIGFDPKTVSSGNAKKIAVDAPDMLNRKISVKDLDVIRTLDIPETINNRPYGVTQKRTRLLFLLQTWTGLSYIDMQNIGENFKNYLIKDLSNNTVFRYRRQKTDVMAIVPLFPETVDLLDKLSWDISPGSYDTYLRNIGVMLAAYEIINTKQSAHLGRHLFGSEMLRKGFSMESISRMMGHSSVRQTEKVYAVIDTNRIHADWEKIKVMDAMKKQQEEQTQTLKVG